MKFRHRREVKRAKKVLQQIKETSDSAALHEAERKLAACQDAYENASLHAMFQATTIWQLQMLIDRLKEENDILHARLSPRDTEND